MDLSDVSPEAVRAAVDEYDDRGHEELLARYGLTQSGLLAVGPDRRAYDVRAVTMATHDRVTGSPLPKKELSRAEEQIAAILASLGFELRKTKTQTFDGEEGIGEVEGYAEGDTFKSRLEALHAGIHRSNQAGIHPGKGGAAESIAVSDGYEDDDDRGNVIIYTGHGGRDSNTRVQIADQTFEAEGNAALLTSQIRGTPVRVLRGTTKKTKRRNPHAPESGYRYDGLFRVVNSWSEKGKRGFKVCRFHLEKIRVADEELTDPSPTTAPDAAPSGNASPRRAKSTVQRIVRSTKVSRHVKELYDHTCQVCLTRLAIGERAYSEGAHIRPLGIPHDGPDTPPNVLCLCPNCHVLFDNGALVIEDDLTCVLNGKPGKKLYVVPGHYIDLTHLEYHRQIQR